MKISDTEQETNAGDKLHWTTGTSGSECTETYGFKLNL